MRKLSPAYAKSLKRGISKIPFLALMGNKVDRLSPGLAQISLKYKKKFTQPYGYLHGGVLASLADTAAAYATRTLLEPEDKLVALELKINYLSPAQADVKASAKVIHKGKRTAVIDVDVKDKKGVLCAKALVTYVVFPGGKYP